MMTKKILLSAVLLACASVHAADKKAYVGLGLGPTSFKLDCASYNPCEKKDSGFKVYGGVEVAPDMAMEAAYIDLGKGVAGTGPARVKFGGNALVLNGAFRYAFIPEFIGVLRLGVSNTQSEVEGGVPRMDDSKRVWKPYFGVALEYVFTPQLRAVLAADYVRGKAPSDASVKAELYSISGQIAF